MQDRPESKEHPAQEPHHPKVGGLLNKLRAAVLGANDGIVSTAGLVVGVAAASPGNTPAILTAGTAGILSGAVSMAVGEYVSVSTQRDTEKALIAKERAELDHSPEAEFRELVGLYEGMGLAPETAHQVATELSAHDPLATHLRVELGIDAEELTSPWAAALASAVAFTLGAVLPVLAVVLAPEAIRIPVTFGVVVIALALTGFSSAKLGGASISRAILRVIIGGVIGMAVTYIVGGLLGANLAG
ncbi:MAG: VIT family protein [Propionibacteriaceae bacterium]|nr:VIT family protein [Propionibacteriaceae bacterium]